MGDQLGTGFQSLHLLRRPLWSHLQDEGLEIEFFKHSQMRSAGWEMLLWATQELDVFCFCTILDSFHANEWIKEFLSNSTILSNVAHKGLAIRGLSHNRHCYPDSCLWRSWVANCSYSLTKGPGGQCPSVRRKGLPRCSPKWSIRTGQTSSLISSNNRIPD